MIRKLGPHAQHATDAGRRWAIVAPIVKQIDGTDLLHAAPDGAIRVFRPFFWTRPLSPNPEQAGIDAASDALVRLNVYRHPNLYVELYNEIGREQVVAYLAFTRAAARVLHGAGVKLAAFSWSTGVPEPGDWRLIQQAGFGGADALALHEYWGRQGFTGWNALRYRRVHAWLGGKHPPILITECGRDAVEGSKGSWRADGLSAEHYLAELEAYDAELAKDSYVLGACVFTTGPAGEWKSFGVDELADQLATATPPPAKPAPAKGGPMQFPMVARLSPNHDGTRPRTLGVVIHTTRSGVAANTLQLEYQGTVSYFCRPGTPASAHAVVGPAEIALVVPDHQIAWHARENNQTHLGIELAQPTPDSPLTDWQLQATAFLCQRWAAKLGFPLTRVLTQTAPGLVGHEDTEQGKRDGKTDPGSQFDWPKFLGYCQATPPAVDTARLERDLWGPLWRLQDAARAAGRTKLADAVQAAVIVDKHALGLP